MTRVKECVLSGFLLSALFTATTHAATRTAASCNANDVQTAMNLALAGDTVVIPAGVCIWTTSVTWTAPANTILQGAGSQTILGGGDATVIVDDYASTDPLLIIVTPSAGSSFRLFGITFQGGSGLVKQLGVLAIGGNSQNSRVDHNHFNLATYSVSAQVGVRYTGWVYGVMDHNLCDDGGDSLCVDIWTDRYGGSSFGDGGWADNTAFGSANFLFVEDNTINGGLYADDCDDGGREVFRHNTVNNAQTQTHPTGSAPRFRGCRAKETYQNTFNGVATCNGSSGFNNCLFNAFFLSSGASLFWGNNIPVVSAEAGSAYQWLISIHSMRRNSATYTQLPTPNGWGYCGTTFDGIGSNWDQNTAASTGYSCLDQPGSGKGDLLANDFPNAVNTTTGTIAWPHQALEPVYEWLDAITPVPGNPGGQLDNYDPDLLMENRDFYLYTASFNGTSGVGSGLLSARPTACTPTVAYWATDTNMLYQCLTTNTWTPYYTPYNYPHPLIPACPPNMTCPGAQMPMTASGLAYSRVTKTFVGTVTITNTSGVTINGPFQLVLGSLTAGVTLVSPSGTYNGIPYITFSVNSLAAGQTATVSVQFNNPSNGIISFNPMVYGGTFN